MSDYSESRPSSVGTKGSFLPAQPSTHRDNDPHRRSSRLEAERGSPI